MQGYSRKFVVQGIHMIFNGELGGEWEKEDTHTQAGDVERENSKQETLNSFLSPTHVSPQIVTAPPPLPPRRSKLVFIGVNLPHVDLKAGFEACICPASSHTATTMPTAIPLSNNGIDSSGEKENEILRENKKNK
jgi:hypothetical protein